MQHTVKCLRKKKTKAIVVKCYHLGKLEFCELFLQLSCNLKLFKNKRRGTLGFFPLTVLNSDQSVLWQSHLCNLQVTDI